MHFVKYQGTGNDFIIVDGRAAKIDLNVAQLCHRRFGIGADGLMVLVNDPAYDFRMVYYNSDGKESSMCGNGGRCIAHFASSLGLGSSLKFIAIDGPHEALVKENHVELSMSDVQSLKQINIHSYELDTGSPHYVNFITSNIDDFDLLKYAKSVRHSALYDEEGINVNVVFENEGFLNVRTFERGVEDETYSCGTGVTAAALSYFHKLELEGVNQIGIKTLGGELKVQVKRISNRYENIILSGPATPVFTGKI